MCLGRVTSLHLRSHSSALRDLCRLTNASLTGCISLAPNPTTATDAYKLQFALFFGRYVGPYQAIHVSMTIREYLKLGDSDYYAGRVVLTYMIGGFRKQVRLLNSLWLDRLLQSPDTKASWRVYDRY